MDKFKSMLEANRIAHETLQNCKKLILDRETITKEEVQTLAQIALTRYDVPSSFKGVYGFPYIMCISVNDEVIHGAIQENYTIVKGDLVSLDFGVIVNGYCSDCAISFVNDNKVSNPIKKKRKLVRTTEKAINEAVKALEESFPNCKISDITAVLHKYSKGYGVVKNFGGHGIGKELHDGHIFIPNSLDALDVDKRLEIGDVFTIEPMYTLGSGVLVKGEDGFTLKTSDGSLGAHFELSIAITKDGVVVLK